jgi:L-threonylcarbamoyladenylate synthase
MKYRHYAPKAPLTVYTGDRDSAAAKILEKVHEGDVSKIGFFVSEETAKMLPEDAICYIWGKREDKESFAHNLFTGLLYFNEQPVEQIYGEGTDQAGIGRAIMNRLKKASGGHIVVEEKET